MTAARLDSPTFSWRWGETWPRATPGFIFLAGAVQKVGRAKFGHEWTGDEPTTSRAPVPLGSAEVELMERRERLKRSISLPLFSRSLPANPTTEPQEARALAAAEHEARTIALAEYEEQVLAWAEHRAAAEAEGRRRQYDERFAALMRRTEVASWIADAALSGRIETFVRPDGDCRGDPVLVGAGEVWACNPPLWGRVFERCMVPMVNGDWSGNCFIFLGKAGLEQAIRTESWGGALHPRSMVGEDEPLVEEMQRLLDSGEVPSRHAAAVQVAVRAAGGGTAESKIKRLERRHRGRYPD